MRDRAFRRCLIVAALVACLGLPKTIASPTKPDQASDAGQKDASNQAYQLPDFPLWWDSDQEKSTDLSEQAKEKKSADWWMVRLTGVLGVIGLLQLTVFGLQARRLKQTIDTMDHIASRQNRDMASSIEQAAKAAVAMQDIAKSMSVNAESVIASVAINKTIAERQKIIGELQTRSYIAVAYMGIVPQNIQTNYRLEVRLQIIGTGLTPAYRVRHRSSAAILAYPLPAEFTFPLPDRDPNAGEGMLGPRNSYIIAAATPRIYSEEEIRDVEIGAIKRIYVWGIIDYEDAFGIPRYFKFCQSVVFFADRTTTVGYNEARHNDAN
jgi:hypothetical protein